MPSTTEVLNLLDTATFDLNKLLSDLPKESTEENNAILKCTKCNFNTHQQDSLVIHIAYVHDQTFFVCNECETRTKTDEALQFHKQRKHVKAEENKMKDKIRVPLTTKQLKKRRQLKQKQQLLKKKQLVAKKAIDKKESSKKKQNEKQEIKAKKSAYEDELNAKAEQDERDVKELNTKKAIENLKVKIYLAKNLDGLEDSFIPDEMLTTQMICMMEQPMEQVGENDEHPLKVGPMTKEEYAKGMLLSMLPEERDYHIEDVKIAYENEGEIKYEAIFRTNITTEKETRSFLEDLYDSTGATYNIKSSDGDRRGKQSRYYGNRKCIMNVFHNTQSKDYQRPGLHRDCPASVRFSLENEKEYHKRDSDEKSAQKQIINRFPLQIKLDFQHNHQIYRHEHTRYLNVSEQTKKRFTDLFEDGLTASAAWHAHRSEISTNRNAHIMLGNRRICPDYFWAFKFQRKWIEDKLGSFDGIDAYQKVQEFCKKFDETSQKDEKLPENERYAKVEQTTEGETVVVIIDAFMRRVHKSIPQAGDIMIMDATSNLDRSDTKLFHLMCPSAVGALPLTTIVTSREDEKTILHGLKMMKRMLPQDAFYGRGPELGPTLGLTDDAPSERNALRKAWPLMELLLCHFHVLQVKYFTRIKH